MSKVSQTDSVRSREH